MRTLVVSTLLAATLISAPARAESAPPPAATAAAPSADKAPESEPARPKESPLPFAMYMAGAGVGTAVMGGYLTFATDDTGSNRLGVPLMVAGGLSAAAGVAVIVLSGKAPAKSSRRAPPRVEHRVSVGPTGAAYSMQF